MGYYSLTLESWAGCDHATVLVIPARLQRAGMEIRMVLESGSRPASVDPGLFRQVVRAHALWERLSADPSLSIARLAQEE